MKKTIDIDTNNKANQYVEDMFLFFMDRALAYIKGAIVLQHNSPEVCQANSNIYNSIMLINEACESLNKELTNKKRGNTK